MADVMTAEQRHYCMSKIRQKGTKPEMIVRNWLWTHGYRYRLNVRSVLGKPDIVMRKYRTAIFVNGCFWHGHRVCRNSQPQTNKNYWEAKIKRNIERDKETYNILQNAGWQVIVIWECQLKPVLLEHTMSQISVLINKNFLRIIGK